MRNIFLFVIGLVTCSIAQVQFSIEVNVPAKETHRENRPPSGYVVCDEDMVREDLEVIDDMVGFWIQLPSGRYAFHYRRMWYCPQEDEWYYGPWCDDRGRSYRHYPRFRDHMCHKYPKYYERRFHHHEKYKKHRDRGDDRREHHRDHDRHDHGKGHGH